MDLNLKTVWAVFLRDFEVYKKYFINRFVSSSLYPFLFLFAIGYGLGKYIGKIEGLPYPVFIAPALVASAAMFASSFATTYGTYVRLKYQRTFQAIMVTPASADDIVIGEILYAALRAAVDSFFVVLITYLFGLPRGFLALLLVPVSFLSGLVFAILGVITSALITHIDHFDYYFTLFISLMFLFSGTFFPLKELPPTLQKIALIFPLTHTINLMRPLFAGYIPTSWLSSLIAHFIYIVILFPPAHYFLKRRIIEMG